ncbi:uncharacterized protein LOC135137321 [Zophobas morio]|uniref:uncharacterized protein LOC135137321 n=1 Tax=Zophobas morio TaxID=2755281 RepID=UPI0030827105
MGNDMDSAHVPSRRITRTTNNTEPQHVCSQCSRSDEVPPIDYYWRDYLGIVPRDAVPGGHDVTNRTTYIGQGFYSKAGLLTGTIYPGISGIKLPYSGSNTSEIGVKVLCSPNATCFQWKRAESTTLHSSTIGKHLVIGGFEDGKMINIGRAMFQGELVVGKVLGFQAEKAKLYFIHGDKEYEVSSYEVLIYQATP